MASAIKSVPIIICLNVTARNNMNNLLCSRDTKEA